MLNDEGSDKNNVRRSYQWSGKGTLHLGTASIVLHIHTPTTSNWSDSVRLLPNRRNGLAAFEMSRSTRKRSTSRSAPINIMSQSQKHNTGRTAQQTTVNQNPVEWRLKKGLSWNESRIEQAKDEQNELDATIKITRHKQAKLAPWGYRKDLRRGTFLNFLGTSKLPVCKSL